MMFLPGEGAPLRQHNGACNTRQITYLVIFLDIVALFGYTSGNIEKYRFASTVFQAAFHLGKRRLFFCRFGRSCMARKGSCQVKIPAHIKEGEKEALTRHWQKHFLDHLAESSNITESAKVAGINPSRAYLVRRQDPAFARQWLAALWEGYLHLELEVLRRLREGDLTTSGSDKYDFANAIRLLTAHRDNAARAQAAERNVSAAEVRASIDRKVEAIRQQVRDERDKRQ